MDDSPAVTTGSYPTTRRTEERALPSRRCTILRHHLEEKGVNADQQNTRGNWRRHDTKACADPNHPSRPGLGPTF